jgi:hypothetical protein
MAAAVGENTAAEINGLKRKADMQMMYCTVCNIFLNSSSQADAHFSGKSHKNKAKSRGLEVGVLRLPVFNTMRCQFPDSAICFQYYGIKTKFSKLYFK